MPSVSVFAARPAQLTIGDRHFCVYGDIITHFMSIFDVITRIYLFDRHTRWTMAQSVSQSVSHFYCPPTDNTFPRLVSTHPRSVQGTCLLLLFLLSIRALAGGSGTLSAVTGQETLSMNQNDRDPWQLTRRIVFWWKFKLLIPSIKDIVVAVGINPLSFWFRILCLGGWWATLSGHN